MAPSAILPTDTVDSFRFLLQQIEREIHDVFSDIKEVFAVIGVLYAAKKTITVTATVLDAVRVHLLPERRIDWVEKFGPWAGLLFFKI